MGSYVSDKASTTVVVAILLLFGNTVGVLARVVAKRRAKRSINSDDYWMFVALLLFYGWVLCVVYIIVRTSDDPLSVKLHMAMQMAMRTLYLIDITAIKVSILLFYLSIFDALRWFQISARVVSVLCIFWAISGLVPACIVFYLPECADFSWGSPGQSTVCVRSYSFLLVHRWLNPALDIIILFLPVVAVLQIHLPLRQKIQALGVFLVGSLVVLASIVGIFITQINVDSQYGIGLDVGLLWYAIELGIAILCGNLPTYRPLLGNTTDIRKRLSGLFTSNRSSRTSFSWSRKGQTNGKEENEVHLPHSAKPVTRIFETVPV